MTKEEQKEYNHKYYLENKKKLNKRRAKRRDKINEYSRKYYSQKKQRLAELEQENNKLLDVINNQDVKIADLEQQIEKMKCCWNCKYGENKEGKKPCSSCNKNWGNKRLFKKLTDKWELEEKV